MAQQKIALAVGADAFYMTRSQKLGELTLHGRLPAIFQTREFVAAGKLASYRTSTAGSIAQPGTYVARVLR